jgi:hypothetical protein
VCFGGALAVARLLGPARALQGLLLSIALRTGAPLLFLLSVQICVGVKAYPTLVYSFLFVYLVALAIETPLSLPAKGKSVTVPLTRG